MRIFERRHPNIAVMLAAAAALLAACGGDDDDEPVACAWASCANNSPIGAAAGGAANAPASPANPAGDHGGASGNGPAVGGNSGGAAGGPTNGAGGNDSSGAAGAPTDGSGGAAPVGGSGGDPQAGNGDPQAGSSGTGMDPDAGTPPDDPMPDAAVDPEPDPDPDPSLPDYTLIVEAPADGASVTGVVKVTGRATAFLNVEVWDSMHQTPPLGRDVPDADGRFEISIDTAALSTGATTWTVHAWDSPPGTSFDNTKNVQLDLTITRAGNPGGGGGDGTPDPGTKWVPAGYSLAFSDEFNGTTLDTGKWNTLGPWGVQFFEDSKQKQAFVPEAVSVHDGILTFTANRSNGASNAEGQPYVSGSVTTNRTFTHGYFETRTRVPAGKGFWPAYWLTSSTRWPPEWDIFEIIDNVIYGYPHPITSGKCQFVEGAAGSDSTYTIPNLYGIYHVYGLRWTATDVWWYVDGVLTEHYAVDAAAGANDPYWLNISLQVGGDWPGDPDGTTPFPGKMDVDYMRVYQ